MPGREAHILEYEWRDTKSFLDGIETPLPIRIIPWRPSEVQIVVLTELNQYVAERVFNISIEQFILLTELFT